MSSPVRVTLLYGETEQEMEEQEEEDEDLIGPLSLPEEIVRQIEAGPVKPMWVRRLTPTEGERLQGFPDLWTIPSEEALERWGRSISTPLDGTSSDVLSRLRSRNGSASDSGR